MNLIQLQIARDLQKEWAAYKVGGCTTFEERLRFSGKGENLSYALCLSVEHRNNQGERKGYTCIDWIYGDSPNDCHVKLLDWIRKDMYKHEDYKITRAVDDHVMFWKSREHLEEVVKPKTLTCESSTNIEGSETFVNTDQLYTDEIPDPRETDYIDHE